MTQNIKDVVLLGVSVAELVDSVADGVSLGDVLSVVGVLKKVKPAVDAVKSGQLINEYKNLSPEAKAELVSWFESELDLRDDKIEALVESAWKVVIDLNDLVKLVKS